MSEFTKVDRTEKHSEQEPHKGEEVKVLGKISRLFFQGQQLYPVPKPQENEPSVSKKKSCKHFVILPVKDKNSTIEFIKVPMYKAETNVEAKFVGCVDIQKINLLEQKNSVEKLSLWSIDKGNLQLENEELKLKSRGTESPVREYSYEQDVSPQTSLTDKKETSSPSKVSERRKSISHRGSLESERSSFRNTSERTSNRNSLESTPKQETATIQGVGQTKPRRSRTRSLCPRKDRKKSTSKKKKSKDEVQGHDLSQ